MKIILQKEINTHQYNIKAEKNYYIPKLDRDVEIYQSHINREILNAAPYT